MVVSAKSAEINEKKEYESKHEPGSDKNKNQNPKRHDWTTVKPGANAVQQLIEQKQNAATGAMQVFTQEMLSKTDSYLQNTPNIKDGCPFGVLTDPTSHTQSGALIAYKGSAHFVAGLHSKMNSLFAMGETAVSTVMAPNHRGKDAYDLWPAQWGALAQDKAGKYILTSVTTTPIKGGFTLFQKAKKEIFDARGKIIMSPQPYAFIDEKTREKKLSIVCSVVTYEEKLYKEIKTTVPFPIDKNTGKPLSDIGHLSTKDVRDNLYKFLTNNTVSPFTTETYIPKYEYKIAVDNKPLDDKTPKGQVAVKIYMAADGREYLSYSVKSFENEIVKDIQTKILAPKPLTDASINAPLKKKRLLNALLNNGHILDGERSRGKLESGDPDTNRFDTSELSHILITEAVLGKASIGNAILAVSMQFHLQATQNRYLPICVYNHQTGEHLNIPRQNLEFLYMLWNLRHVLSDEQLHTSFYNLVEDSNEGNNLYNALLQARHLSFMAHLILTVDNLRKAIRLKRWDLIELLLQDNGVSPENIMELEPSVIVQLYALAAEKRAITAEKSCVEQLLDKKLAVMDLAIIDGKLQTSLPINSVIKPIYDILIKENTIHSRKTAEALLTVNPGQSTAIKIARQEGLAVMAESAIAVERFKKAIEDLDGQPKKDFSLVEEIVSTTSIELLMQAIPGHVKELRDEAFRLKKWQILSLLDDKMDRFGEWRYRSDSEFGKIVDRKTCMSKPIDCLATFKHRDEKDKYNKTIHGQDMDKCYKFPIEMASDAKDWDAVKNIATHKSYATHPEHDAGFGAALLAASRASQWDLVIYLIKNCRVNNFSCYDQSNGYFATHYVIQDPILHNTKRLEILELMVANGANPNAQHSEGLSLLDLAEYGTRMGKNHDSVGNDDVEDFLREKKVKETPLPATATLSNSGLTGTLFAPARYVKNPENTAIAKAEEPGNEWEETTSSTCYLGAP